jgi:hypothetical protein
MNMACEKLTVEEYQALMLSNPDAKSFATEDSCVCCDCSEDGYHGIEWGRWGWAVPLSPEMPKCVRFGIHLYCDGCNTYQDDDRARSEGRETFLGEFGNEAFGTEGCIDPNPPPNCQCGFECIGGSWQSTGCSRPCQGEYDVTGPCPNEGETAPGLCLNCPW